MQTRTPARPAQLDQKIRREYTEMPGLSLSAPQAARLWSVTPGQSEQVLGGLVREGFLIRDSRGTFRRRGAQRYWR
jgi:hypothetical protein